jgi:hypothetical protein
MQLFRLIILVLGFICRTSCVSFVNGLSTQTLGELFERASRQIANELGLKLQELLLVQAHNKSKIQQPMINIHLQSSNRDSAQSNRDSDFPRPMIKATSESNQVQNQYSVGRKVVKFLSHQSSQFNITLTEVLSLKSPPKFCPFSTDINCDSLQKYRTIDGSCNNLEVPLLGRSSTPYKRYLPTAYDDELGTPRKTATSGRPLPNARYIALSVHNPSDAGSILSNLGSK